MPSSSDETGHRRKYKYPCVPCKKPVIKTQLGLQCDTCDKWVHFKCTDLNIEQYNTLSETDLPFYCLVCSPRQHYADNIFDTTSQNSTLPNVLHTSHNDMAVDINTLSSSEINTDDRTDYLSDISLNSASTEFSEAHSSDFEFVSTDESDTDSDLRGLDFDSLPVQIVRSKNSILPKPITRIAPQPKNYKFPCIVCSSPCKTSQDSIQCTWCDDWVHLKCTNLSYEKFIEHCDNEDKPYHCDVCEFGSFPSTENQTCLTASVISNSLDSTDIYNMCPNSIFHDKDDVPTTEYFTTDELNIEIKKTPNNLRLIHINAVSLCKHVDSIIALIAGLTKDPSIIFISETRVHDEKEKFQISQIKIPGWLLFGT